MRFRDITGLQFGRLTVVRRATYGERHTHWECTCSCGQVTHATTSNLRGTTRSCGCLKTELMLQRFTKHGRCRSREYNSWMGAKQRCYYKKNKHYKDYGARGITMCREWRNDFRAFLRDMGPCPSGRTLDRKNNDGPYDAANCRWATAAQQSTNKRQRGPESAYGR